MRCSRSPAGEPGTFGGQVHMNRPKIFISAVSSQLKVSRDALASDLRAIGAQVVVQEDFQ